MRWLLVRDVMTTEVRSVRLSTPVNDIARILDGRGVTGVPVVDGECTVVGVVSEADLLAKRFPEHRRWAFRRSRRDATVARELMTAPAITIGVGEPLVAAARAMIAHHIKRLPVVDRYGKLQGVLSRSDLIRVFVRSDEELRDEITREVVERVLGTSGKAVRVEVADGVATLRGQLAHKSLIPVAVSLARRVPGVVDVVDELSFALDG